MRTFFKKYLVDGTHKVYYKDTVQILNGFYSGREGIVDDFDPLKKATPYKILIKKSKREAWFNKNDLFILKREG